MLTFAHKVQQPSLANLVSTRLACDGCCRALARVRMLYALGHKIQSKESYQVCLPYLQDQQPSLANLVSTLACVGCCRALARVRMQPKPGFFYVPSRLAGYIKNRLKKAIKFAHLTYKTNSLLLQTWLARLRATVSCVLVNPLFLKRCDCS